jgi:hypothetical protein
MDKTTVYLTTAQKRALAARCECVRSKRG